MTDFYDGGWVKILWFITFITFISYFIYIFIKKRLISVLSTTILLNIFVPLVLMYPFAFSERNIISTGYFWFIKYVPFVDTAFLICLIGIISFILGCFLAKILYIRFNILNIVSKSILLLSNKLFIIIIFIFLGFLFVLMLFLGFYDDGYGARSFAMANPSLRPLANLFMSILPIFISISLLKFIQTRKLGMLIIVILSILFAASTGTRTSVFTGILMVFFVKYNHKKISIIELLILSVSLIIFIFCAVYLGDLREKQYNPLITFSSLFDKVFYGNNLSDLRDFAWIISEWNGTLLYGKSYLAGYLSFIPSFILDYRERWGIGSYTTRLLGFDHSIHPGFRLGIFGESFLNFGVIGVIFAGIFYGFSIYCINLYTKKICIEDSKRREFILLGAYITSNLLLNFMITAGFFSFYVTVLLILFGFFFYEISRKKGYRG